MNRDLVFFIAGLCFGVLCGYFVFRSLGAEPGPALASATAAGATETSPIGLDSSDAPLALDDTEVDRLRAAAEADANNIAARVELGALFLASGQFEEAVAWFTAASELQPNDLEVRTQLALAYLNAGNLDQTVDTYQGSLAIEPNHPASLLGLGRVKLYLQQDIDAGLEMWKKLIAVAPDSAEAQSVRDELEALTAAHPGS